MGCGECMLSEFAGNIYIHSRWKPPVEANEMTKCTNTVYRKKTSQKSTSKLWANAAQMRKPTQVHEMAVLMGGKTTASKRSDR